MIPFVLKENMDASSVLISMKENPTSSQYMDCNFSSTDITYVPRMSYAQDLPSKNDGDTKYYVSYIYLKGLLDYIEFVVFLTKLLIYNLFL